MCQPATCATCKKTTWKGCGQHIQQVKASVPPAKWCTCKPEDRKPQGVFSRLFSR